MFDISLLALLCRQAYKLELSYNYDHSQFSSAKLLPAATGVSVEDVLSYGVSMQDAGFLVRECTERLKCAQVRAQHLATLATRYEHKHISKEGNIQR